MKECYKEDLAYIHDVGHGDFALKSAPGILAILDRNKIREGLVVDLGCGSGLWARELAEAQYDVLGIDISGSMIGIARGRVPDAEFRIGSLFKVDIPPCDAVTSLGECLNYLFDPDNNSQTLGRLFRRIYDALTPGGSCSSYFPFRALLNDDGTETYASSRWPGVNPLASSVMGGAHR
jgi:SAM-dependent methyltransferase